MLLKQTSTHRIGLIMSLVISLWTLLSACSNEPVPVSAAVDSTLVLTLSPADALTAVERIATRKGLAASESESSFTRYKVAHSGAYRITVSHPDYQPETRLVTIGSLSEVVVQHFELLEAESVGLEGVKTRSGSVVLEVSPGDAKATLQSGKNTETKQGDYTFTNLKPGQYDLFIERGGYEPYSGRLKVERGAGSFLEINLVSTVSPSEPSPEPSPDPDPNPEPNPEPQPDPTPEPEPEPAPDTSYGPVIDPSIPSGAVYIAPGQDINAVIRNQPQGTTFVLKRGVHRGQNVSLSTNSTLIGEYGAVLSGGRVVTSFSQSGSLWRLDEQGQQATVSTQIPCLTGYEACQYAEQVFIDNVPLRQVLTKEDLEKGAFYFDYAADAIYLADDPTGKRVEVSVTGGRALIARSGSSVRNLVIEKYNTPTYLESVYVEAGGRFERNEVRFIGGTGVSFAQGVVAKGNYIHHLGRLGVHSYTGHGLVLEDNEIAYNNYAGTYYDHEGGGVKLFRLANPVIRANYAHHNLGPGLWTDTDVTGALYENNTVTDNIGHGIFHEVSGAATIRNNTVARNRRGISVSNSSDVKVYGNILENNKSSLHARNACRPEAQTWTARNVEFFNNTVYQQAHTGPSSEWPLGKAAAFQADLSCHLWTTPYDDWFSAMGNRWYNNSYHLSSASTDTRPFFYWKGNEVDYGVWQAAGLN